MLQTMAFALIFLSTLLCLLSLYTVSTIYMLFFIPNPLELELPDKVWPTCLFVSFCWLIPIIDATFGGIEHSSCDQSHSSIVRTQQYGESLFTGIAHMYHIGTATFKMMQFVSQFGVYNKTRRKKCKAFFEIKKIGYFSTQPAVYSL